MEDNKLIEILANKLGLTSRRIIMKAQELERLAGIRTVSAGPVSLALSNSCQAIICLELAASFANVTINRELALRIAGTRKKVYLNALQMYEKLLDLQTNVTVKDIALTFGCMQSVDLAQQVLKSYEREMKKRLSASVCEGLDLSQPVFAAAAVCATCKKMKIRLDKRKIIEMSRAKKITFDKLFKDMERHAEKLLGSSEKLHTKRSKSLLEMVQENISFDEESSSKKPRLSESENDCSGSYEDWRRKILEQADMEEM